MATTPGRSSLSVRLKKPRRSRGPAAIFAGVLWVVAAAVVIQLLLPKPEDAPPTPVPVPETKRATKPEAALPEPTDRPRGDREAIQYLVQLLGFPVDHDPWMVLELACYGSDSELTDRTWKALQEAPSTSSIQYFRLRCLEGRRAFEELQTFLQAVPWNGDISSYLDGRLRIQTLGYRLIDHGPDAKGSNPRDRARVLAMAAQLEYKLRERKDFPGRLLRVELWDILARRLHLRPTVNLAAMEFADELATDLIAGLRPIQGYARAVAHLFAMRLAAHLGDAERCRALRERFEADAVKPVAAIPEVLAYWHFRLREDEEKLKEPMVVSFMSRGPMEFRVDPRWIPFPSGRPGSTPSGQVPPRAVVPDPPYRVPVRLSLKKGGEGSPLEQLRAAADRARIEGRRVDVGPEWISQHVLPELGKSGPLMEEALDWPGLILGLEKVLRGEYGRRTFRKLLADADIGTRRRLGYLSRQRRWYREPWARLHETRLAAEWDAGDKEEALAQARRHLQGVAQLPPPWTVSEVHGAARVWWWVHETFGKDHSCPGVCRETARVGLRSLEALTSRVRSGEGDPGLVIEELLNWLFLRGRCQGRDSGVGPLLEKLVRILGKKAEPFESQIVFTRFELEKEWASRKAGSSKPCSFEGLPAEGETFPEAAFGRTPPSLDERLGAIFRTLKAPGK